MSAPTHDVIMAIVNRRAANFTSDQKNAIATSALAILAEPRYAGKHHAKPLFAVKLAMARLHRS